MKTQLLYLDAHDDTASTREKLRWAQADRVVLVWPSHGRILHRRVDLVLLAREAARQAAQLGVLSHDPDVREHARQLGMPVFDDLDAVSRQAWPEKGAGPPVTPAPPERTTLPPRPERPAAPPRRRWTEAQRAGSMLVVIAALLGLSLVIGPAAVIELSAAEQEESVEFPVALGEVSAGPVDAIALPSRSLQVEVEGEIQIPTRGTVQAAATAATGWVSFTNRNESEVILPEGTGVRTLGPDPQRFETTERALVPAGIGSEVLVPIRASDAGPAGNVPAGAVGAIEGTLGLDLTVTNPDPTSGGATESRPGVTQVDIALARAALERQLLQEANARLQDRLEEGESLAPDSIAVVQVLASDFGPALGEPSEVIRGSMQVRVGATAFDTGRLLEAGLARIAEEAGTSRAIIPDSVRVDIVPVETGAGVAYQATARGRSRPEVDLGALAEATAGKSLTDAASVLTGELDLAAPPRFRLWPGWWPRMPLLPLRIQMVWVSTTS